MPFNFSKTNAYRIQRNISKLRREKNTSRQIFRITDIEFKVEVQGLTNPRLIIYDITLQKKNYPSENIMDSGFGPMPRKSVLDNHMSSTMLGERLVFPNYECCCTDSCTSSCKPNTWITAPNHAKNKASDSSKHKC